MTTGSTTCALFKFFERHLRNPAAYLVHEVHHIGLYNVTTHLAGDAQVVTFARAIADGIDAVTDHMTRWNIGGTSVKVPLTITGSLAAKLASQQDSAAREFIRPGAHTGKLAC